MIPISEHEKSIDAFSILFISVVFVIAAFLAAKSETHFATRVANDEIVITNIEHRNIFVDEIFYCTTNGNIYHAPFLFWKAKYSIEVDTVEINEDDHIIYVPYKITPQFLQKATSL